MGELELAQERHFLVVGKEASGAEVDYDRWCRNRKHPAVVITSGEPTSLVIDVSPTGRRLNEAWVARLKEFVRSVSAPDALIVAGPAGARSDIVRSDISPDTIGGQAVELLSTVTDDDLDHYLHEVAPLPPAQLKPAPRTIGERVVSLLDSAIEFLENAVWYRFR